MNCFSGNPLHFRSRLVIFWAVMAFGRAAWGGGVITNCTQADLETALNGGGTVTFACAGTIVLTNTIRITQDSVMLANGFRVTISGGNAVRLFQVNSNVVFSLNGLCLANGSNVGADAGNSLPPVPGGDGFGAGILNLGGSVALTDCTFTSHVARGGVGSVGANVVSTNAPGGRGFGAALCNLGGTLDLTNCVLTGNSTVGGESPQPTSIMSPIPAGGRGLGGAIYSANGRVHLQGVTLATNTATGGPRQEYEGNLYGVAGEGFGGAVYATNSELVISDAVLEGNSARGGCSDGLGGALFLDQGSSGLIQGCQFLDNLANGVESAFYYYAGGKATGGAIFSGGQIQIGNSTFSHNGSTGGGGNPPGTAQGGAVCSTNELVINGCTFDNNQAQAGAAQAGGGILLTPAVAGEGGALWSSGMLWATNSTWAANDAVGGGGSLSVTPSGNGPGGPGVGGACCVAGGQAVLVNVTIAANRADGGTNAFTSQTGPAQGGGLYSTNGSVMVLNSIIANSANGGDVWGTVTDGGYNICSDGTAGFTAASSLNQTNPMLGPLADNGGPTLTMALLPGSPALDVIAADFPPVDQRGIPRPQGPAADIGAFERLKSTTAITLGITLLPGKSVNIQLAGPPEASYSVEASSDLVHWDQIFLGAAGADGWLELVDPLTKPLRARYYRAQEQ